MTIEHITPSSPIVKIEYLPSTHLYRITHADGSWSSTTLTILANLNLPTEYPPPPRAQLVVRVPGHDDHTIDLNEAAVEGLMEYLPPDRYRVGGDSHIMARIGEHLGNTIGTTDGDE